MSIPPPHTLPLHITNTPPHPLHTQEELVFGIVFSHPLDAVRFCHGVQHLMMLHTWPSAFTHVFGPRQEAADGMPVFYGPRFAMVVHRSNEYMYEGGGGGGCWMVLCWCVVVLV